MEKVQQKVRTMLVVCMVLFGLQLWSPLMLQAAAPTSASEEVSFRPLDPDDPSNGPGPGLFFDLPEARVLHAAPLLGSDAVTPGQCTADRRIGLSLLPTTGLQPAAP